MQPEKIVIFGPIILFFLFFGALIAGFLFIVIRLVLKGRKSAWKGTVIDKLYNERRDSDNNKKINHFYTLVFKTEEGKEIKIGTSKIVYDTYKIGDKAEKKSGEMWPKKLSVILLLLSVALLTACSSVKTETVTTPAPVKNVTPPVAEVTPPTPTVAPAVTPPATPAKNTVTDTTTNAETTYSISDVSKHNTESDCWMVIGGKVYDVTKYIAAGMHNSMITDGCGTDATQLFSGVGKHSGPTAQSLLVKYKIGALGN